MSRANPSVSVYWLWLLVIAAVLANLPVVPYPGKCCYLPITFLYKEAFSETDVSSWSNIGDQRLIVLHALVSVIVTVVAMSIHRVWTMRCKMPWEEAGTFTPGGVVMAAFVVTLALGALAICSASYVLYGVVLIFFAGRWIAALLTGNRPLSNDRPTV